LGSPFNFPSHIKLAHRTSLLLWCKLQTQSVFVQIFEFLKNHGWGSSFLFLQIHRQTVCQFWLVLWRRKSKIKESLV
jgi:hypothetical protein